MSLVVPRPTKRPLTITSNTTLIANAVNYVRTATTSLTLTLPVFDTVMIGFELWVHNESAGNLTVSGNSSNIQGGATLVLATGVRAMICKPDQGTEWKVLYTSA